MKICWDNLNKLVYRNNVWVSPDRKYYIYIDNCKYCKESYLARRDGKKFSFCSYSCRSKYYQTGNKATIETKNKMSISQKKRHLGVVEKNLPLYDTFAEKLAPVEEVRIVFEARMKLLEVKCKKCKAWFVPTRNAVKDRSRAINTGGNGYCNFYCSEACKESCGVYGQSLYPKNFNENKIKEYTNYELSIWSKEILKRANYKCEYCGEDATDAHHVKPKKLEPFFALDPDYGVACCEKCHYKYGHVDECSTGKLAKEICV